ncbi:hypothetical protein [Cytobacillus praedii]|uniref:hypothetical protein n=1 Tax=Cytobacillus praedii TaxID=1742358 RepID=UPI002E221EA1
MKAVVSYKYGSPDILELKEIEKPVPLDNQVLIKIHASLLNFGNLVLLKGQAFLRDLPSD